MTARVLSVTLLFLALGGSTTWGEVSPVCPCTVGSIELAADGEFLRVGLNNPSHESCELFLFVRIKGETAWRYLTLKPTNGQWSMSDIRELEPMAEGARVLYGPAGACDDEVGRKDVRLPVSLVGCPEIEKALPKE